MSTEIYFSSEHFDVVANEERGLHDMKNYAVVNRTTNIGEHYSAYLAEAVEVAKTLDGKMEAAFAPPVVEDDEEASATDEDGNVVSITKDSA